MYLLKSYIDIRVFMEVLFTKKNHPYFYFFHYLCEVMIQLFGGPRMGNISGIT